MSSSGLALIYLKQALRQSGCPICRCTLEHETRYLKFLLWENVNDLGTRVRMAQSLGFCARHARQLLYMEQEEDGLVLGNSIIYESLIALVLAKMREVRAMLQEEQTRKTGTSRFLRWLGIVPALSPKKWQRTLSPARSCRVCELGQETAQHYGQVLVEMLSDDEFRDLYERSDGICLPHLRMVLQRAGPNADMEWLLSATENRLQRLRDDLERLAHSYSITCQDVGSDQDNSLSVERAIAFLTSAVSTDHSAM